MLESVIPLLRVLAVSVLVGQGVVVVTLYVYVKLSLLLSEILMNLCLLV